MIGLKEPTEELKKLADNAVEAAQHFDDHAASTRHPSIENQDYIRGYCAGCEEGYIKAQTAYEQSDAVPVARFVQHDTYGLGAVELMAHTGEALKNGDLLYTKPVATPVPVSEPPVWECKVGGLKPLSQRLYEGQTERIKRYYSKIAQSAPTLQDSEQYRMQIAAICTAAQGYWRAGDSVHMDYDTPALRDVAALYAKYEKLFNAINQMGKEKS